MKNTFQKLNKFIDDKILIHNKRSNKLKRQKYQIKI
jgi:hypothetical protein